MEQHTINGERICAPPRSFRHVLPIIRHHHEKSDGSGYPDGLKGDQIPIAARILQVTDIYDALTTNRPYRQALPPERALGIMWEEARRVGYVHPRSIRSNRRRIGVGWQITICRGDALRSVTFRADGGAILIYGQRTTNNLKSALRRIRRDH
jgi:hypothetical protein